MNFFINPGWLWGLGAVAIPVVLHLFFRRRYVTLRWAAMRFLKEAVERSASRRRLTQILLMAVRMLLLALLALAFARPYLSSEVAAALARAPQNFVLVLDRSMSLGYREQGTPLWERLRSEAAAWIRSLSPGDRVLVLSAPPVAGRAISFTGDMPEAAAEVEKMELAEGPADLLAALFSGWEACETLSLPQVRFLVATDMQRRSFGDGNERAWNDFARRIQEKGTVGFVDVGAGQPSNIGLTGLAVVNGPVAPGRPAVVRATIFRSGGISDSAQEVPVTFWVDGTKKESRLVAPPPHGAVSCDATLVFDGPGFHEVMATVPADPLEGDNRLAAVVPAKDSVRIGCVYNPEAASDLARPTSFLECALSPAPGLTSFQAIPLLARDLADTLENSRGEPVFDALLLADVPILDKRAVEALERYVRRGKGVAFFPAGSVDADFYNAELYRAGAGILPARLARIEAREVERETGGPLRLIPGPAAGLFLAPFPVARGDLGRVAAWRRWVLEGEGPFARVLLAFDGAGPALVARDVGRGTALVWGGGVSSSWTNLPARPVFLPWVHQLVRELTLPSESRANLAWGESLRWEIPVESVGRRANLVSPAGERYELTPVQEEAKGPQPGWEVATGPLDRSGLWRLALQGEREEIPIAVGLPPGESDLTRLKTSELEALLPGLPLETGRSWGISAEKARGADLSQSLLFLILAFLYVESYLAWRAGRPVHGRGKGGTL